MEHAEEEVKAAFVGIRCDVIERHEAEEADEVGRAVGVGEGEGTGGADHGGELGIGEHAVMGDAGP